MTAIEWARAEIMVSGRGPDRREDRPPSDGGSRGRRSRGRPCGDAVPAGPSARGREHHPVGRSFLGTGQLLQADTGAAEQALVTDEQRAQDFALLGGFDLAEIEAATEKLLSDHSPMVRRLADVLVERKVLSGRRARQFLYKAQRKTVTPLAAVAEKDRRNQQVWAAEMRQSLGQVA